jgi:hypothetical protein
MLKLSAAAVVLLSVFASVAFAGSGIDDPKALAGDWRSMGNVNRASIHINEDGAYQGIAASGAQTTGRITVTGDTASYKSATSEGSVTLSKESGKDVLTFVPANGRPAKLEKVK